MYVQTENQEIEKIRHFEQILPAPPYHPHVQFSPPPPQKKELLLII